MRVSPCEMIGMIMTSPQVLRPVISYQQAFPMMPAVAKDIIILLALGRAFLFIQIEPFSMWVLLDAFSHLRSGQDTIARGFEEEAEIDIHQAVKTEALINPANLGQQLPTKSHQVALDCIHIRPGGFTKLTQVIGHQSIRPHNSHIAVRQCHSQRLPDIAFHFYRGIHQHDVMSSAGTHGGITTGSKTHSVVCEEHLQTNRLPICSNQLTATR